MTPQVAILFAVILFIGGVYVILKSFSNIVKLSERVDKLEKEISRINRKETRVIGKNWEDGFTSPINCK